MILSISSCTNTVVNNDNKLQAKVDSLEKALKSLTEEKNLTEANIKRFDSIDMIAFNNKDLKLISKYYDKDVIIYNNDATQTKGWENAEKDIKEFFATWPDMKSESQVARFGNGEWVFSIDHITGTFTKPMKMKDKTIQPNERKLT